MDKNIMNLFIDELEDILSAELQIVKALPVLVNAAESPKLKLAFSNHLKETKGQIVRLEKIFRLLNLQKKAKLCKGAKGLIDECKEVIKEFEKSPLRDAAIISKAQRIEHYEISAYGTMRAFADKLGFDEISDLLEATEDEEANADKTLTKIAQGTLFSTGVNQRATNFENFVMSHPRKNSSNTFSKFISKMTPHKKATSSKTKAKTKVVSVRAKAKTVSPKSRGKTIAMKTRSRKTTTRAKAKR